MPGVGISRLEMPGSVVGRISRLEVGSTMISRMTKCGWESRWVQRNERRVTRSLLGGLNWLNRK